MKIWRSIALLGTLAISGNVLAQEAEFVKEIGSFSYFEKLDPFTDIDNSFVGTMDSNEEEFLYFRCSNGKLESLMTSGYLGSDYTAPIEFRFDKKQPSGTKQWDLSTNGTAVFVPADAMGTWVSEAKSSSKLVIRMTDYDYSTETYTYDLTGLSEALSNLSCATGVNASL